MWKERKWILCLNMDTFFWSLLPVECERHRFLGIGFFPSLLSLVFSTKFLPFARLHITVFSVPKWKPFPLLCFHELFLRFCFFLYPLQAGCLYHSAKLGYTLNQQLPFQSSLGLSHSCFCACWPLPAPWSSPLECQPWITVVYLSVLLSLLLAGCRCSFLGPLFLQHCELDGSSPRYVVLERLFNLFYDQIPHL